MLNKILATTAACVLLFVISLLTYQELSVQQVKVNVQLKKGEDPFLTIRQIVPNDSRLVDVHQVAPESNMYQLTVNCPRRKNPTFLEWLKQNKKIERYEVLP